MVTRHSSRPRMSRTRLLLTGLALLLTAVYGIELLGRALYAPWSLGVFGRETLTGGWVGAMRAREGTAYALFLELAYKSRDTSYRGTGGYRTNNLVGRAVVCTPAARYEYAVSGFATPWGIVERMWLEYPDPQLSARNLRLSGEWRPPVLGLSADANPFLPDEPIAPFELTRGELDDLEGCP